MAIETVHYGALKTSVGRVWVASSAKGVVRVALAARSEASLVEELERFVPEGARLLRSQAQPRVAAALRELAEYFGGRRRRFTLALDLGVMPDFSRRVLEETATIPWGRVTTYGDIAQQAGRPRAARAVGGALGSNPVALFIPCHRVVAAGGGLGGFSAGPEGLALKRRLLALEGTVL